MDERFMHKKREEGKRRMGIRDSEFGGGRDLRVGKLESPTKKRGKEGAMDPSEPVDYKA